MTASPGSRGSVTTLVVLVRKLGLELARTLGPAACLLSIFFVLGTYLFVDFGDMNQMAIGRLSPEMIAGVFGGMLQGLEPLELWLVTLLLHPFLLVVLTVAVIAIATRALAGEIDRGTIDLLLSHPIPRWQLPLAAATLQLLSVTLLVGVVLAWISLGLRFAGLELGSWPAFGWVAVNLWSTFLAIGAICLAFSAAAERHGVALGRAAGFVLVSFLVNLLASLWSKVRFLEVLSVFHYYRPQPVVTSGSPIWGDLATLLTIAFAAFVIAVVTFQRRDIATT